MTTTSSKYKRRREGLTKNQIKNKSKSIFFDNDNCNNLKEPVAALTKICFPYSSDKQKKSIGGSLQSIATIIAHFFACSLTVLYRGLKWSKLLVDLWS